MTQDCTIDKIIRGLSDLEYQLKVTPASEKATINNNEQPSERPIEEKRTSWSWCDRVRERVKEIGKVKNEASNHGSDSGGSQGGSRRSRRNIGEDQKVLDLEVQKLQSDIRQMKAAFENLTQFQTKMSKRLEPYLTSKNLEAILKKTDSIRSRSDDLKEIRKKISALKCEIPSLLYKQSSRVLSTTDSQTAEENGQINETGRDINLPGLHVSEDFKSSSAFKEVAEKFLGLEDTQKQCLLSFAVFPENREVKRTMLMYWWVGEGFIICNDPESSVRRILEEFSMKGLLEPVEDERKLKPNSYKMEPHVHSAVIYLAEFMDQFELYSSEGKLIMKRSKQDKVCLVRGSSLERKAISSEMRPPKSLKTVFNSSERYPDFTFKWFREMDQLRVLYLGRWERTAKRHIEVESTEFLDNMKNLKNLRLASFQGISRIEKLEKLVCALPKLVILDLRACYNLEVLPDDIGSLESLIYLDVSECYMLDRMPKGIAYLSNLQVLKGFVISQSDVEQNCAVKHLTNLKKLSITVNKYNFTVENLMESLKYLKQLESLKIAWGAQFDDDDRKGDKSETEDKHNVHKKGQTSKEKNGDGEEKVRRQVVPEYGDKEKVDREEGKKLDGVKAESLKSDNVVEGEKKTSLSQESTKTIQKKPDDQKGKSKVEEEGKKHDEVKAESLKSEKVASPSRETIQNKPDDQKEKSNVEGDGDKGKADLEEGKKQDEVQAEKSKSDKVVEGEKKASPSRESSDTIQKNQDDKSQEGGGDKGNADPVEGKKQDEVKAESSKSDNGVEGVKKASPSRESTDTIQKKPDDYQRGDKQEDKGDGEKEKVDLEEGKKKDEVKAESTKVDKVIERDEKTSRPQESKDMVKSTSDDHQSGDKQEEKGEGEKEKVNREEGKKKYEVKAESSKPDKVIEGNEKANPPQESKDTIQSKPDDHKENSKVQEKGDGEKKETDLKKLNGGEEKTHKSDKTKKFGKKVSFSEEPKALIQKKLDDLKRDDAKEKEIHETASSSRSEKIDPKESRSSKPLRSVAKGKETKKRERRHQEITTIETSKLPTSLKKLELECFPHMDPPSWLHPKNLDNLEKLSIKGGKLSRISDKTPTAKINNCGVQILRLKYLHEFKAEWKDLQAMFPQMKLFEKFKCSKVGFCPTDGNGVWRSQPQASPDMPR